MRIAARQRRKERFTSLFLHISIERLGIAFSELRRDAAAGVDGLTWQDYERDLERNREDLHAQVQRGAYRALPSQRRYIPKADDRQRSLAPPPAKTNCPESDCRGAQLDLRGRLSWILAWIPSQTRPARRAGRTGSRHLWMAARIRINLAEDAGWPLRRANRQDFWRAGQSAAVSTAGAFLQLFSLTAFCL